MQNTSNSDSTRKFESGNLILVGMMGSGKTTMGRVLAKHLGKDFVDS
ncbi:MAG: shikimate kinase, partial [Gallionella sp.]|nr:shikimate kinase [Gallionella sp.]